MQLFFLLKCVYFCTLKQFSPPPSPSPLLFFFLPSPTFPCPFPYSLCSPLSLSLTFLLLLLEMTCNPHCEITIDSEAQNCQRLWETVGFRFEIGCSLSWCHQIIQTHFKPMCQIMQMSHTQILNQKKNPKKPANIS